MKTKHLFALAGLILLALIIAGCAPNSQHYAEQAAGFWSGIWHGLIIFITFVLSLFFDAVGVYEANNTGGWYDFGFLLGLLCSLGQGGIWRSKKRRKREKSHKEKEWEEIGKKVEAKVKKGIQNWVDESKEGDSDWKEIGKKVEEKIRRELKNWVEK